LILCPQTIERLARSTTEPQGTIPLGLYNFFIVSSHVLYIWLVSWDQITRREEVKTMRGMRGGGLGGFRGPSFRPGSYYRPVPIFRARPIYRRPLWGLGSLFWGMGFLLFSPVLGVIALLAFAMLRLIAR
jgi:hypothetical protein